MQDIIPLLTRLFVLSISMYVLFAGSIKGINKLLNIKPEVKDLAGVSCEMAINHSINL